MKILILLVITRQALERNGLTTFHQLIIPHHPLDPFRNSHLSAADIVRAMMHYVTPPVPAAYKEAAVFKGGQTSNLDLFDIIGSASKFLGLVS